VDGGKKCDDSQKKQQDMIYDFFKFMDVSDDQGVFLLFDVVWYVPAIFYGSQWQGLIHP
jgi:hypothetical protein